MTRLDVFEPHIGASGRPDDGAIAATAARQHGVIAHWQLVDIGLGRRAIQHRVATGRLHRIHLGAFAVGHRRLTVRGRWMAAVLACGPDALLSHQPGGSLWDLIQSDRSTIDVTVPGGTRRDRRGIAVHRVRSLHPDDRAVVDGIPVTSLARTLLDLAAVIRPRRLDRAVETAERLQLFDLRAIERLLERSRGHRGCRALVAAIDAYRPRGLTRSELERLFLDVCRNAGLPSPSTNLFIAGEEVDAVWPDERLVVELDSRRFHGTRAAFERDRIKDAQLQLAGYRVLRVTYRRLETEPEAIVDTVRKLLAVPKN